MDEDIIQLYNSLGGNISAKQKTKDKKCELSQPKLISASAGADGVLAPGPAHTRTSSYTNQLH